MNILRQAVKHTLAAMMPRHRFMLRGPTSPSLRLSDSVAGDVPLDIALTFDDGPHPVWTPAVLDELAAAGWKGTFFVVGERAEKYPGLLRRIVGEGHTLGNHTYSHSAPETISASAFLREVQHTRELIGRLAGETTTLVRPPLGKLSWRKSRGLLKAGQSIILWNIDPKDFRMQEESSATAWAASYDPAMGDVVLLHDRMPYAAAIIRALSQAQGASVQSVTISDWLPAASEIQETAEVSLC